MPRKGRVDQRAVPKDYVYQNEILGQFINKVMRKGKKSVAERIVYGALNRAAEKTNKEVIEVLNKAMSNVMPQVEVKSRRVGGATYQVPMEVRPRRKVSVGLRWIVQYSRERKGMPMEEKLALELVDAYNNTGASVKKREDTHRMAEANKAFAHYRW